MPCWFACFPDSLQRQCVTKSFYECIRETVIRTFSRYEIPTSSTDTDGTHTHIDLQRFPHTHTNTRRCRLLLSSFGGYIGSTLHSQFWHTQSLVMDKKDQPESSLAQGSNLQSCSLGSDHCNKVLARTITHTKAPGAARCNSALE